MVGPNEDFVKRATEATPAKRAVSRTVLTMATDTVRQIRSAKILSDIVAKADGTNLALGN